MINSFSGIYRFLSNFYPAPATFEGVEYPTSEHAFQAAKTLDPTERAAFLTLTTPGQAKRKGRTVRLREDWEEVKYDVMKQVVRSKFEDEKLKQRLIETGTEKLVEGNTWGDRVWGVCDGKSKNWLGKILMEVRDELNESEMAQRTGHSFSH